MDSLGRPWSDQRRFKGGVYETNSYAREGKVTIVEDGKEAVLSIAAMGAAFEALEAAGRGPKLEEVDGIHYPREINAVPQDEQLAIYMKFDDGVEAQFVFPAPGKTRDQVASASEAMRSAFAMLYALH